ncbi:MAG TPA: YciK family oxidoreductase [Thiohalobacter sp.]|nr:YciK family oxidoreductase [Thiohalobacter sp.]
MALHDWQPTPELFADRVMLITGAGDGIGRELARQCAGHGATVILLGRTVRKLESVYDEILAAGAPEPVIHPMDLAGAQPEDYITLADALAEQFGRLDALVHNAAMLGSLTPITHYPGERWYQVMQTNLHAPFLLSQACLGLLNAAGEARVLFVADEVGRRARAYWGAYAASKAGLEALMQTLAAELETNTGIRVNSLDPGAVRTRLRTQAYPGEDPNPLPLPAEVIDGFLYLLGPDGQAHTGRQFTRTPEGQLLA